ASGKAVQRVGARSVQLLPVFPYVSLCLCGELSEKAFHHEGTKTQRRQIICKTLPTINLP
ncbi:MAG TPA: hypothetical protein VF634_04410, partial [Pyrinomonadaceae bacterium]